MERAPEFSPHPHGLLTLLGAGMAGHTEALSLAMPEETGITTMRLYVVAKGCCDYPALLLAFGT
jgi:hypothetical protein